MPRTCLLGCALSLILLLPPPSSGENFLVWSVEADLFNGPKRAGRLSRGEITSGHEQREDPSWVTIERGGQRLTTERKHLRTALDIREYFTRRIHRSEVAIQRLEEKLTDAATDIEQRQLALLQLDRDSVIAFRLPVTRPAAMQVQGGTAAAVTQFQYVDKLPANQARKLRKQLGKEMKRLKAEEGEQTKLLIETVRRLANDQHQLEYLLGRFERYRETPQIYRVDPYIVTAEAAPFFTGTKRSGFLSEGTIVLAQRQGAAPDWLQVNHAGRRYTSAARFYVSYSSWRKSQLEGQAIREREIAQLEAATESLSTRIRTSELVERQLDYDSRLEGEYRPLADLTALRFGSVTLYEVQRPLGAIEVVQRSPAKKILKQWRNDRKTLEQELRQKDERLNRLQREQLTDDHYRARTEERLDAFFEALEAKAGLAEDQ